MKSKTADYVAVTGKNSGQIARYLELVGGAILVVGPGHRSRAPEHVIDASLMLFQDCHIDGIGVQASWANNLVAHRKKSRDAKLMRDRDYWLRRRAQSSEDRLWDYLVSPVEQLALTMDYGFQINLPTDVYRTYLHGTALYMPTRDSFRGCFTYAVTSMVIAINERARRCGDGIQLTAGHVRKIVDYIMGDLDTAAAVRENAERDRYADPVFGI